MSSRPTTQSRLAPESAGYSRKSTSRPTTPARLRPEPAGEISKSPARLRPGSPGDTCKSKARARSTADTTRSRQVTTTEEITGDAQRRANSNAPPARNTRQGVEVKTLTPTTLYVRIRPMATEGGHKEGEEVAHKLKGWTEESVTMADSARKIHEFKYPTKVIVPELTQEEMYNSMMPSLVDAWINQNTNVMMLAYGQTGTGKTHTMLGPQESLKTRDVHPDWGILPRVVHTCFATVDANRGRVSYIVTASAVEFYLGMCCDLLNNHIPLEVDFMGVALGIHRRILENMEDFYVFLDDVKRNRVTSATKMNTESSRSHCAMLLTIFRLDHETRMYSSSKFNLFDLAGSERADKIGERATPAQCMEECWLIMRGTKDAASASVGVQGYFINMELTALATEIQKATDQYKHGKKYNPMRSVSMSSPFQRYTGEIMTGHTLLTTCICISPAPQNGSENLFSLKWGQNMAYLRSPINIDKPVPVERELKKATDIASKAARELKSRGEENKYYNTYLTRAGEAEQKKQFVESLIASASSQSLPLESF